MCPLCLDTVPGEDWAGQGAGQGLGHRAQCCSRNTAKLSTYPAHALPCPRCGGKLRLWPAPGPASKFRCSAERGACLTNNTGSKIRNNGKNRCLYHLYNLLQCTRLVFLREVELIINF